MSDVKPYLAVSNVVTLSERRRKAQAILAKVALTEKVESVQANLKVSRSLFQHSAAACAKGDMDEAIVLGVAALDLLPRGLLKAGIARAAARRKK